MSRAWYIDAADLLAQPDPGPTPWLVENLIVEQALIAAVGRWKTTKSYALLDVGISIATGHPAFGTHAIPTPGPVVFVNEESGQAALWRRLDALCRGREINPEELRGRLLLAANERVKLDHPDWQARLIELGGRVRPRLFVFDPLARMKAAGRNENEQGDMAPLIDFVRQLRDETEAAVCFVHHVGHGGGHMRGSSDLESMWETRLTWTRDGQSPVVEIESEHREAEAAAPLSYRISWDAETRTMRLNLLAEPGAPPLGDRIIDHLRKHGGQRADDIATTLKVRRAWVVRELKQMRQAGTTHVGPSGRLDKAGRPIRDQVWNLTDQAPLWPVPQHGTTQDEPPTGHRGSVARPVSLETDGRTSHPDDPPPENGGTRLSWVDALVSESAARAHEVGG